MRNIILGIGAVASLMTASQAVAIPSLESTQAIQNPAEPAAATNAFIKATWVDALDSGLDIAERLLDDHLHHHQVRTLAESATASTEFNRADKAGLIEAGFDLGRHLLKDHGH